MAKSKAADIEKELTADRPRRKPIRDEDYLSLGVTTLNLAVSGRADGGIPKGKYLYFVGDSASGKSWFSLSLLAEACRNPHFDGHRLIYDASENGTLMDIERYFGAALAKRLEPPRGTKRRPEYSATAREFYFNLDRALDAGPCVYIEDSMDALRAEEDDEKFEEQKAAHESGKDTTGSYGTAKAKVNSNNINRVVQRLEETKSILVVISQTRDKIGGLGYQTKTRSGGKALRFYAHVELWTSVKGPIKKTVMGKEREVGSVILVDVQKNRLTGWEGKAPTVPFYRAHGLDDTGACVEYLLDEKHWAKDGKGKVTAPELGFEGKQEALIQKIEEANWEGELRKLVGEVWDSVEAASVPQRKARYT